MKQATELLKRFNKITESMEAPEAEEIDKDAFVEKEGEDDDLLEANEHSIAQVFATLKKVKNMFPNTPMQDEVDEAVKGILKKIETIIEGGISDLVDSLGDSMDSTPDKHSKDELKSMIDVLTKINFKHLTEGVHYNTKIKMLEANHHPTKVRLGLKAVKRMINEMLDDTHPSPNPADDDSRKGLQSASKKVGNVMESLKLVSVKKRGRKIDEGK